MIRNNFAGTNAVWNIPNLITLGRGLLAPPIFCYLAASQELFWAALVFALAASTDFLDGTVARRFDLITRFGELIDPLADKVIVITALVWLTYFTEPGLHWYSLLLIMPRETMIIFGRLFIYKKPQDKVMKVSCLGKWKSTLQYIGITYAFLGWPLADLVMAPAVAMTLISGWDYFVKLKRVFYPEM